MINFKQICLEDKAKMEALVRGSGERSYEYLFTNMFAWHDSYLTEMAEVCGCYTVREKGEDGNYYYLCPAGGDEEAAVEALAAEAKELEQPLKIISVSPKHRAQYEAWFPGCFEYTEERDYWDYCYQVEKLAELAGKKLHGKRNHINKFLSLYPDWSFEELSRENLKECLSVENLWLKENEDSTEMEGTDNEILAIRECLNHWDELGLEGGLLRVGSKVVAFTIGEPVNDSDTYDIHFEKADISYEGSFTLINREFARLIRVKHPEIKYINREEDMGLEGLRQSKLSYKPDMMLIKYTADLINDF